jgi:hypothetical protein
MPQDEMVSLLNLLPGNRKIKKKVKALMSFFRQTIYGKEILDAKTDPHQNASWQHHKLFLRKQKVQKTKYTANKGIIYIVSAQRNRYCGRKLQRGDAFCVLPSCNVPRGRLSDEMHWQQQHLLQNIFSKAGLLSTVHPCRLLRVGL